MPKTANEKCRLCAKLSAEEAIARHGPDGTNCWVGGPCHKRRTYYPTAIAIATAANRSPAQRRSQNNRQNPLGIQGAED